MRAEPWLLTLAHRLALLVYIVFALFPLFWLLKVSVTPNDLLYTEGVRMWPSHATLEHFSFVLQSQRLSDLLPQQPDRLGVDGRDRDRSAPRSRAMRCRASPSAANTGSWR